MSPTLQPQNNGPLKVSGAFDLVSAEGSVTRKNGDVWLCRSGQSASKPFCDSSHKRIGFSDPAHVPGDYQSKAVEVVEPGAALKVSFKPNGPVRCVGEMHVLDANAAPAWSGAQASFCRCGASNNKPFCDGTHREIGFEAA